MTPSEVETLRPYAPFGIDRDPSHFGLRREAVAVGDRHIETYRRDGADPANATVFLHGIDMDWSTWTPLLHAAAQLGHDTEDWVFLDLPGFGRSSPLRTTDNLASIGTLLAAVFQELEIQKPHIVGHSMGGFLLLDMISRNPELATRATVLCGAYATVVDIVNHPLAMIIKKPTASSVFVPQIILSRLNVKPIATIPRLLRPVLNLLLRPLFMTPKALAWSVVQTIFTGFCSDSFRVAASSGLRYQVRDVWQQISTPTTAAFGRFDRMVDGGDIRLFTQCVPAADVNLLPESGHFPHIEEPHRVTALIAGR